MRRLWVVLTVVLLVLAVAAPAVADKPVSETIGPFTVPDIDPCTGDLHDLTFTVTLYTHVHGSNVVTLIDKVGVTDSGYVLVGGSHKIVANENVFNENYKDVWRNPDTGAKMQATGRMRIAGNSSVVDTFALRCIGAPTILP